jgi:hypothetical protein
MRRALPPDFLPADRPSRAARRPAAPRTRRAAIAAAVAAGYGIEIDLQGSADGEAMVFHDDTLDRLTAATGPVAPAPPPTWRDRAERRRRDGIPTLAEVLALVAGRVPLLIEIKDQSGAMGRWTTAAGAPPPRRCGLCRAGRGDVLQPRIGRGDGPARPTCRAG